MLSKIYRGDVVRTNSGDYIPTTLNIDSCGWSAYSLETELKTANQGFLRIWFEHFGTGKGQMRVEQLSVNGRFTYTYKFPLEIFKRHVSAFISEHVEKLRSGEAFQTDDIILGLVNDVLENYDSFSLTTERKDD